MRTSLATAALLLATMALAAPANAVEVLVNGNLEGAVAPSGWTQAETITGMPGTPISLMEHLGTSNSPNDLVTGGFGVLLKPAVGNQGAFEGQFKQVNYVLSQTVPAQTGQDYKLKFDAFMGFGFSGAQEFLDPLSPGDPGMTGTVPSPTTAILELAFLNASNAVIGAPAMLNVGAAVRTGALWDSWNTHELVATPPTGTTQMRATFSSLNMVENFGGQEVSLDNFLLTRGTQTINRLTNGDLNIPGFPAPFTLTESPAPIDNASIIGFAHHVTPEAPSGQGMWMRAFSGGNAVLEQIQPGVAGGQYKFTAWSRWEGGYSGGVETLDASSPSGAIPSPTETEMELAFLDVGGIVIGTPALLDLRTVQMNDNTWRKHSLMATAPAGTVSVRVRAQGRDMIANIDVGGALGNQSAFFDELSLDLAVAGQPGDFDGDLDVDGNDFLLIQRGLGTTTTAADFTTWRANFGTHPAVGAVGAVPEPATVSGAAIFALAGLMGLRRRR